MDSRHIKAILNPHVVQQHQLQLQVEVTEITVTVTSLVQLAVAAMSMLDLTTLSVFGHPLSQKSTYAERLAYRENILHLPGPVDRWLTANSRSPRFVMVLQNYLMLADVETEYVTCLVEREYLTVSASHSLLR